MRIVWHGFRCEIRGGLLVCRGPVQPTPLHDVYRVRLEYRIGESPKVWVESPKLLRRTPEERIPHTYEEDRPCLYFPPVQEWRSDKRLAQTIMPWLLLWLVFYEGWRVTGEWEGGGIHPAPPIDGGSAKKETNE
jgi:hypothetical protein